MTENTGLIVIFGQKIGHMIFIYLIIQFWSTDPHSSGIQMVVRPPFKYQSSIQIPVGYSNGIQIMDHLAIRQLLTISIPD